MQESKLSFDELLSDVARFEGVTDDSSEIGPGWLFVAGAGREKRDQYLADALQRGASAVVGESSYLAGRGVAFIAVNDRLKATADLACEYYGNPSRHVELFGVTGTCGKTTSTYLLEAVFRAAGRSVGVIGTENIRYGDTVLPSPNTTPGAFMLQRTLRQMVSSGCDTIVMEVSSHALEQRRSLGLLFDGAIFTNLSTEHLDLHGSMQDYFSSKCRLFTEYADRARDASKRFRAVINVDDEWGRDLHSILSSRDPGTSDISTFSMSGKVPATFSGANLRRDVNGIHGQVGSIVIDSQLIGKFNCENILGAMLLAREMRIPDATAALGIAAVRGVPGRMERVASVGGCEIIVDFAHKPGALRAVLGTLRELTPGKLVCVFGCGGSRDLSKRPEMGAVSAELSDITFVTADNTRGEDPRGIFSDILAGVPESSSADVRVMPDRAMAIQAAIKACGSAGIVLIAGRGSESHLDVSVGNSEASPIEFDDRVVARNIARQCAAEGIVRE